MKATLLDTATGETLVSFGISAFNWTQNNFSCDCNRAALFDNENEICSRIRYIVVGAEIEGDDVCDAAYIAELNAGYPQELASAPVDRAQVI